MPILAGDLVLRLSGGASNSDADASLGGAKSSNAVTSASLHNLFDKVSGAESAAGDTEYRCVYIHNGHGSLELQDAEVNIQSDTSSSDTDLEIGLGTSAVNATEQTVANESTAPAGVTFESGATPLVIGDIPAGEHKALWIKRVVSAAASADALDAATIRIAGDTAA